MNIIFFNFVIYFFVIKIATILLFYFSLGQLNDSRNVEKDDPLKGNISKKDTNDGEGIFFIFSVLFYFISLKIYINLRFVFKNISIFRDFLYFGIIYIIIFIS